MLFRSIILNFISNAVKFTLSGKIKLCGKFDKKSKKLKIYVEDSGLGIKDEDKHLIFHENTQLRTDNDYNNQGSGLGLSISKQLCDFLKYKIGFVSRYGKGSKFYLRLAYNSLDESSDNNYSLSEEKINFLNSIDELVYSDSVRSEIIRKNYSKIDQYYSKNNRRQDQLDDNIPTITNRANFFKISEEELPNITLPVNIDALNLDRKRHV